MHKDKCNNCGSTKSSTFWDFKDKSMLCDICETKIGKHWEKVHNSNKGLKTYECFGCGTIHSKKWFEQDNGTLFCENCEEKKVNVNLLEKIFNFITEYVGIVFVFLLFLTASIFCISLGDEWVVNGFIPIWVFGIVGLILSGFYFYLIIGSLLKDILNF